MRHGCRPTKRPGPTTALGSALPRIAKDLPSGQGHLWLQIVARFRRSVAVHLSDGTKPSARRRALDRMLRSAYAFQRPTRESHLEGPCRLR
jgi:hypothetical protein